MKQFTKVYFITVKGEPTYIGVTPNKKLTLMTKGEAVLASATTAEPVFIDTVEGLKEFSRFYRKPIKSHHLRNGVLTVAGLTLVLGTSSYALNSPTAANILDAFKNAPTALSGQMINQDQGSDIELETKEVNEAKTEKSNEGKTEKSNEGKTEKSNEAEARTFDSVLAESTSEKQKQVVAMMADYIRYFNGDFANTYKEVVELTDENGNLTGEKIEIKPALKWEYEVPALAIAYNDYSAQKLHAIFNGADLDAEILDKDYKVATLQLFASYVISDRSMPVNLANLVESEEGKAFVQKYEDMFYSIKEAKTDEEKAQKINAFYQELYKDFPIDEVSKMDFSENEVGIAHSESITTFQGRELEKYKLAITPMVSAIEVMYQNLEIDATLQDDAIRYFNLLGECNLAYKEFVKAETASECGELDETLADFDELSDLIIAELRDANAYVIDDMHRELSFQTEFQELVNGHFNIIDGEMDGSWWYYTDYDTEVIITYSDPVTRTVTHTRYEKETKKWTTDDREEAVKHVGEEAVKEAEEKVNKQIEKENQKAKEDAEKEADKEQQKQQEKENKNRENLEQEVKEEHEKFDNEINDNNDKINENNKDEDPTNDKPVNEKDFTGQEVNFDDEHSNSNGDLDDSVKDITKDGTGANEDMPDPNKTGEKFDDRTDSAPVETESKKEAAPAENKKEESKPAEQPKQESKPAEQPKQESKPAEQPKEESKPAEQPKQESKPAEQPKEESKPAEQPKQESKPAEDNKEEPAEVHFESNENDQYEEYTTTGCISDEELVNTYIANLEAASPEELAAIRRL